MQKHTVHYKNRGVMLLLFQTLCMLHVWYIACYHSTLMVHVQALHAGILGCLPLAQSADESRLLCIIGSIWEHICGRGVVACIGPDSMCCVS
jgi:hypothetical protein